MPISIDTRRARVAEAAIQAGADIVNDVSGGCFDPLMFSTVARLGVPMVIMHMRGTPKSMQSLTDYEDIVKQVSDALLVQSRAAQEVGIHRWLQLVDPGIGFAKDFEGNLRLLKNLGRIRHMTGQLPILLGTSRKGFIGMLTGVEKPSDRDIGSISSCVASFCIEGHPKSSVGTPCNVVRVHNVGAFTQALKVMDAIRQVK